MEACKAICEYSWLQPVTYLIVKLKKAGSIVSSWFYSFILFTLFHNFGRRKPKTWIMA